MEFAGNVLHKVDSVEWYYIIGLFIFIVLFIVMIYRTLKMPKETLLDIKQSIFENDELSPNNEIIKQ